MKAYAFLLFLGICGICGSLYSLSREYDRKNEENSAALQRLEQRIGKLEALLKKE